ncbi:hypothetical protein GCM10023168_22610 [Fodinibacter luteus]|uniref:CAAX prenyl protease 2/Lysostaphin resistance protein A-like domain-containing protein n=1 Tax=Fodinibacter luteus TaxID=552064 RepID=A0ABP8KH72_9MICO
MSVRIAVVVDPADPSGVPDPDAVRAALGGDVASWVLPPSSPALTDLSGLDGVWVCSGPGGPDGAAALAAVRWARTHGVPVLASGAGFDTGLVEAARTDLGAEVAPTLTPALAGALGQRGWVVHDTTNDGEPLSLGLPTHPFLVLTRFRPWPGPHPALTAFVEAARTRARYREWSEEDRARATAMAAAEAQPRPYVHQMRGPRHRWWRPLVAGVVGLLAWVALAAVVTVAFWAADLMPATVDELGTDAWGTLYGNLVLAALIPATFLALWVGHRRSPWRVLSVAGRFRWGWALRCTAVVTPIWAAYLVLGWVVLGQEVLPRAEQWVGLVAVSLLTTPLQAAGEEIAFRGGLVQSVGSWFRSPVVALLVTTVLSTAAFAAAHGSADPWILVELGSLAAFGCYLAWRTGGLEAVIVIHVVNNLLITVSGALLGGLEESYVDASSAGSPVSATMTLVVTGATTALLLWLARRRGIAPAGRFTPALG